MDSVYDRLENLLRGAEREILLVAPFMKETPLRQLLGSCSKSVSIQVVTRWRPEEIHRGVSDLEVLDVINARSEASLFLRHDLHAKLFAADGKCLIGSANLTSRGLGIAALSNLELMLLAQREQPEIAAFEAELFRGCMVASTEVRGIVASAVESLQEAPPGIEVQRQESDFSQPPLVNYSEWLPRCTVPQQLYSVYRGDRSVITQHTFEDASYDLEALDIPPDLNAASFRALVASRLIQHPLIGRLATSGDHGTVADKRTRVLEKVYTDLDEFGSPNEGLRIIESWLRVFLPARDY